MPDSVLYELQGGAALVTLNRPESLNSMSGDMLDSLAAHLASAAQDPEVRCVVVTGAGRAFTAGGDVKGMAAPPRSDGAPGAPRPLISSAEGLRRQEESSRLLYEMPKPTIAAVNGPAAGAGMSLALAADIRIASDAARFTTAFARIGLSGDFGGTWLLQRLLGPARAKELYFMAEVLDAQQALSLGLVSKVVPADQFMPEVMALARRLAAGPTLAYGRIKDNFSYGATATFGDTLTREAENIVAGMRTEDHRSAAVAFVEKREPVFRGR